MKKSRFGRAALALLTTMLATVVFAQAPAAPPAAAAGARKEVAVAHDKLARLVGTYELTPQMKMTITLDGEQLLTQLSGQPKFPLFAETETKFFLKVVDAQLEFKLDPAGQVTAAVLQQNGQSLEARRTSSTVFERKEVKLAAAVLALYPGNYAGIPMSFTITLEDGHLMAQPTGQQKLELFAEAEDKFFLKAIDAQVEFIREAGKVKALVLQQGANALRAERQ